MLLPALPLGTVTTLVQAFAGILLPSTLVLLLILCNDKQLLGPLTNGRWLNASAITAVTVILALSTMLTLTAVVPHLRLVIALAVTVGMLGTAGSLLALSYVRGRRPRTRAAPLTPWQHRTWSAPPAGARDRDTDAEPGHGCSPWPCSVDTSFSSLRCFCSNSPASSPAEARDLSVQGA